MWGTYPHSCKWSQVSVAICDSILSHYMLSPLLSASTQAHCVTFWEHIPTPTLTVLNNKQSCIHEVWTKRQSFNRDPKSLVSHIHCLVHLCGQNQSPGGTPPLLVCWQRQKECEVTGQQSFCQVNGVIMCPWGEQKSLRDSQPAEKGL